jgi:uncharacterized membrane protein YozB (DUF420 family)
MNASAEKIASPPARRTVERLYLPVAVLATVMAFVGFWPTYFGPLLRGTAHETLLIHVHGALHVGWLALFAAQILLAATGRVGQHIKFGKWVMGYALVVIAVGLLVAFETAGANVAAGEVARGQRRLFGFIREVVFFAAFIAAGWGYRHKPHIHKRLMVVAMTIVLVPAVGRMTFLSGPPTLAEWMLVWPLPVYLAMLHDFVTKRLIHPVYMIGWLAMLAERLVLPLRESEGWMALSAWFFVPLYQ